MTDNKKGLGQFLKTCPYVFILILLCLAYWVLNAKALIHKYTDNDSMLTTDENAVVDTDNALSDIIEDDDNILVDVSIEAHNNSDLSEVSDNLDNELTDKRPEITTLPEYNPNIYPYNVGEIVGSYVYYEAVETSSKYYTDPGRIALTSLAEYTTVDDTYFEDACFVGDSRMTGIYLYSGWTDVTFYCDNGYSVTGFLNGKVVTCMNSGKKSKLEDALGEREYGKIYIMLGINDCGYGDTAYFKERYSTMLDSIRELQPNAIIYLLANLNIGAEAEKSDNTGVYSNININDKNVAISELANPSEHIYYLNYNAMFCENDGYLSTKVTFDGYHLLAEYYALWTEYFKNHAVVE